MKLSSFVPVFCAVLICGGTVLAEGNMKDSAKEVAKRDGAAIVAIKVVLSTKITQGGREMPSQERENEALGFVIDKDGVIVSSYFGIDPLGAMAGNRGDDKVDSEIKSAKLVRKDGTETPLKVVLRDADLDLIFFRTEQPADLPAIEVRADAPALGLADDVVILSRLGAVGDRQPALVFQQVQSVVEKPRKLYVTETIGSITALGCPAYDSAGKLVGLLVVRVAADGTPAGVFGGLRTQLLPAVLPVAEMIEDVQQIEKRTEEKKPEGAKPEDKKPEEKKPEEKKLEEKK